VGAGVTVLGLVVLLGASRAERNRPAAAPVDV
jgi:hypothetical protein